jgi:hypothetical protein
MDSAAPRLQTTSGIGLAILGQTRIPRAVAVAFGGMGFFDKAKAALGLGSSKDTHATDGAPAGEPGKRAHKKDGRPPLRDIPSVASGGSLEDALAAHEGGRLDEARKILASLDRGKGLRTVLRAAAALEAGDEDELGRLLPAIAAQEPAWTLPLQIASALGGASEGDAKEHRAALIELARAHRAPAWAVAWTLASSPDDAQRTKGMVDLLFVDAALARTVAARDWKLDKAVDDREAVERYASFAHGRDCVRRFGALRVADVLTRARGKVP